MRKVAGSFLTRYREGAWNVCLTLSTQCVPSHLPQKRLSPGGRWEDVSSCSYVPRSPFSLKSYACYSGPSVTCEHTRGELVVQHKSEHNLGDGLLEATNKLWRLFQFWSYDYTWRKYYWDCNKWTYVISLRVPPMVQALTFSAKGMIYDSNPHMYKLLTCLSTTSQTISHPP